MDKTGTILDILASIYYPIFFGSCMILDLLLFYLIYTKTTKVLSPMRCFLYPLNSLNFLLAMLTFFLQFRNVHNNNSLALMCLGPCKFLGADWCFHGYIGLLVVATTGGILNIHNLYYKKITIKLEEKLHFWIYIFGFWYLCPIVLIVLYYNSPIDLDSVYTETFFDHPDYDFSKYLKFGGFANSPNMYTISVTLFLMALALVGPIMGLKWRWETLKTLDENRTFLSEQNVVYFRKFIQGLGLQIMVPLLCNVPVGFFYVYSKFSGNRPIISEYTLCFMITLPALLDPILQIYFIVPYQKAVREMLFCHKNPVEDSKSEPVF